MKLTVAAALADATAECDPELVPRPAAKPVPAPAVTPASARRSTTRNSRSAAPPRSRPTSSRGRDASGIEVYGYGKTMPVKSCPDQKNRKALNVCLEPNRRVEVELQGMPR